MPYVGELLTDLLDETPIRRFAHRTTRRVGDDLKARVAAHTPVAEKFEHENARDFVARRGGRTPGTLKRSWRVGEVTLTHAGRNYRVDVMTFDPVAPHVEWDTVPHIIVPRDPDGMLVFETARGTVFAKIVHHPGTTGVHMMATAIAETARMWRYTAEREWRDTVRLFFRGGGAE